VNDGFRLVLRYAAYLSFTAAALVFWSVYAVVVLGFVPFADPACSSQCPEPTLWKHALLILGISLPLPLTVLVFVFYRRWIRRVLGYQDD